MLKIKKGRNGFTLIELLVVVAIIGILASVVLATLNTARVKARDARRKTDLKQIANAFYMYYDTHNNWMQNGSGCGYNGEGHGWFNLDTGLYVKSIAQCLMDEGLFSSIIIDPSGNKTCSYDSGNAYMKYTCGTPAKTYLFAKLEGLPQSSTATDGTCCSTCDSGYGMNYYITIE